MSAYILSYHEFKYPKPGVVLCRERTRDGEEKRHKLHPVGKKNESQSSSESASDSGSWSIESDEELDFCENADSVYHLPVVVQRSKQPLVNEDQMREGDRVEIMYFIEDIQEERWFRGTLKRWVEKSKAYWVSFDNKDDDYLDFSADRWRWPASESIHSSPIK